MRGKGLSAVIIAICFIMMPFGMIDAEDRELPTRSSFLYVGSDQEYQSIQDALDNATDGDTIRIYSGTYSGPVIVNRSVSIIGNGTRNSIIKPTETAVRYNDLLTITADRTVIKGITFTGKVDGFFNGVKVLSSNNSIENCHFENCISALIIRGEWNRVSNNTIIDSGIGSAYYDRMENLSSYYDPTGKYPIGVWKFEEEGWNGSQGEVKDSAFLKDNGTTYNDVDQVLSGNNGKVANFSGNGTYIDLGNSTKYNFGDGGFTASAWIWLSKNALVNPPTPGNYGNKIIQKRGGADGSWGQKSGWMMAVQKVDDTVRIKNTGVDDGNGGYIQLGNMEYIGDLETWIHMAMVWDGTNLSVMINGGEYFFSKSNPDMGEIDNDLNLTIGAHWNSPTFQDQFFYGMIDEVKVYNRSVSKGEIRADYNGRTIGAVRISDGSSNLIQNNTIDPVNATGIILENSDDNEILKNKIGNSSDLCVWLREGTHNNEIIENRFTGRPGNTTSECVDDGTNNIWNDDQIGNYWEDHQSPDINGDGIVDIPRNISGSAGAKDNYPITICSVNRPPKVHDNFNHTAVVDVEYNTSIYATDLDRDPLTFSLLTNATWLDLIDDRLVGTPDQYDIGRYFVNITANDTFQKSSLNFTLNVVDEDQGTSDPPTNETDPPENNTDPVDDNSTEVPGNDTQGDQTNVTNDLDLSEAFPMGIDPDDVEMETTGGIEIEYSEEEGFTINYNGEWGGVDELRIHSKDDAWEGTYKVILLSGSNTNSVYVNFDDGEEQYLIVLVDPDMNLIEPLTVQWFNKEGDLLGEGRIVKFDLPPGEHDLILRIEDGNSRIIERAYSIHVKDGRDPDKTHIIPVIVISLVILLIIMIVLVFSFYKNRTHRRNREEYTEGSIREPMVHPLGFSVPAPGGMSEPQLEIDPEITAGPLFPDLELSENCGGRRLNDRPDPIQPGSIESLISESFDHEDLQDMGMSDREIIKGLENRLEKGEITEDTYYRIIEALDEE